MSTNVIKKAFILIGPPGAGKTTYESNRILCEYSAEPPVNPVNPGDYYDNYTHISSDELIGRAAEILGTTYDQIFSDVIGYADKTARENFTKAINDADKAASCVSYIVVDRTNMSVKSRKFWVDKLKKSGYDITAVVFPTPEPNEWKRRLDSREGKTIPDHVLKSMLTNYQKPTLEEGFNQIFTIDGED